MTQPRDESIVCTEFPPIRFAGELRPSQQEVVQIADRKLSAGRRRLHIVAPPGSGKTVLGLYLWAECVRRPALVLSPNSAIQAQWAARTDLFDLGNPTQPLVSTDAQRPALLTSLTYQAVTMPERGDTDLDPVAVRFWIEKLIEEEQAQDPDEARVWIDDLRDHNPDYYADRLARYRKKARDELTLSGQAFETLHASARATLQRLLEQDVGMIILDECHHLMGHWGRVLSDAHDFLEGPIVVGLTATPPDETDRLAEDVDRYQTFFGPVDFEVPVPAVVKDGFLAPYQDLAYFVRPTAEELKFIAAADQQFEKLMAELCQPLHLSDSPSATSTDDSDSSLQPQTDLATTDIATTDRATTDLASTDLATTNLATWVHDVLDKRRLPTGTVADWSGFARRDPALADAGRWFLLQRGIELPVDVPRPLPDLFNADEPEFQKLVPLIDRYVRHFLRRSPNPQHHQLAEHATSRLRMLGVQITETGTRACASPVSRVLAYSKSKTAALLPILRTEAELLGQRIRAVVVTDYEKTSAITAEVSHLLDEEAGGAVAAFKAILSDPTTNWLDPILVTGSSVLIDNDLERHFHEAADAWLATAGRDVQLSYDQQDGFHIVRGKGRDWCPRVYVRLITDLFHDGVTRCLVGTRGLLGEGWDSQKLNVLIDLTTATTSMTVNQLRGRSIRLDPDQPDKLANNWDVVCIAPEFSKGLEDYKRFIRKHQTVFGITDDGAIEKGVGHVHAAFTELKPEGLEQSTSVLNEDMLRRAGQRNKVRSQWNIGEPYHAEPIQAVESKPSVGEAAFPPFHGAATAWSDRSLVTAIGRAVLGAMVEAGIVRRTGELRAGQRAGGYVRVFLTGANEADRKAFSTAIREALGPLDRPRYVVPRHTDKLIDSLLSRILPSIVGRYFVRRERSLAMLHAVPTILGKNKELAELYQRHWNQHVSPGEAIFAQRGSGEETLERARRNGKVPLANVHDKEIFL